MKIQRPQVLSLSSRTEFPSANSKKTGATSDEAARMDTEADKK